MFLHVQEPGGVEMITRDTKTTHPHGITELCEEGRRLYSGALRSGRIARYEVEPAPCLMEFALLHADPDDPDWLRPVPPSTALAQHVNPVEREIQERRRALGPPRPVLRTLPGHQRAGPARHPRHHRAGGQEPDQRRPGRRHRRVPHRGPHRPAGGGRNEDRLGKALERGLSVVHRGIRMRTLYQHTVRYSPSTLAYAERIADVNVEIRTSEELIERLIIFDDTVAFIPAQDDRQVALELRHPGLVAYLASVFEKFWAHATPLLEEVRYEPTPDGISAVQRSIAQLLVEGHVDDSIARRLRDERTDLPGAHRQTRRHPGQQQPRPTRLPDRPVGHPHQGLLTAGRT